MRAIILFITSMLIFSAFPTSADAQLFNRLKDRAKQAAENKVEEKISNEVEKAAERAVERSWNSIFGDGFGSASGESGEGFNFPFKMNSNAATEDAYTFQVITTMEIETNSQNGKDNEPVQMQMHFSDNGMYSGTKITGEQMEGEDGEVFLIYDMKNESMVMLMESEDGKFSFAYDWKQAKELEEMYSEMEESSAYQDEEHENDELPEFERIGTKNIAGVETEGYRVENEDELMEFWMATDSKYGIQHILHANSETKAVKGRVPDNYPNGMLMEMMQEDRESGETITMKITDINKNANVTYQMSDYPSMTYGGSD